MGGLATGVVALGGGRVFGAVEGAAPTVKTTLGPVVGATDGGIAVFKGIRYGIDTRLTRFAAPRAPEPWDRPLEALAWGPTHPQRSYKAEQSEDCLFLNVWTPGLDRERRPVMVWLHPGAYSSGTASTPTTDGTRLARRSNVVVVSLNHRLHLFGYAYLARLVKGFDDSGFAGQLDIQLALGWVRDNIARFGGDPQNVTLFGQSGGGAKIATLMATPAAAGLFHRGASMSGQQVTVTGPINATRRTLSWLDALKIKTEDAARVRELPTERLVEAWAATDDPILGYGGLYFGPVLDDRNIHRHPFYPDAAPQSLALPMIIGNTTHESGGGPAPDGTPLTWETLPQRLTPAAMRIDISPDTTVAHYRRLYPHMTPEEVLVAATTAGRSWRSAIIEAEERAKAGAPAFVYQQDFPVPGRGGRALASHGSDIAFVFDTLDAANANVPGAARMVDLFNGAFTAFARTGDPNHAGLPRWAPYSMARRETMVMNEHPQLVNDPRGEERKFFARVPYVQPGT